MNTNNTTIEVLKETIAHIEKANRKWEGTCDLLTMELRTVKHELSDVRKELQATKKELAENKSRLLSVFPII